MTNYHYLKAHTDPAVIAYQNSLKEKDNIATTKTNEQRLPSKDFVVATAIQEERAAQIVASVQQKLNAAQAAANTTTSASQIMANAPKKAPVPKSGRFNKHKNNITTEPAMVIQSVDM